MAASTPFQQRVSNGQLTSLDNLPHMDPAIGTAIASYSNSINSNRQSYRWLQALVWIENILFGLGRQWNSDILHSRLSRNTDTGDLAVISNVSKKIPQPTNDFVGRYVETNISLLTENRPQPRITAKSDARDDKQKAELSQLVLDYLWEEHNLPEKHREAARLILYCGIAFMEICYDPTEIRHLAVQQTETEQTTAIPGPDGQPIMLPVPRQVPVIDPKTGAPKIIGELEYGDIACKLVGPFELHFPQVHSWDDIDWVMKEAFLPTQTLKDRLQAEGLKKVCVKKNGWDLEVLKSLGAFNVQTLPLWWWERLTTAIEGPGPNIYVGNPELWDDHAVMRTFDRKPCPMWPNGRTIITVNDRVLYDSPKDVGARAYDPRWPHRWHPYVRFRWEAQCGSILGRSLVSKLLPKIKRINAIDTALIMWRRTVPMAAWVLPKGSSPIEDIQTGRAGVFFEYDPRKTMGAAPQPVPPTPFPAACLEEREFCKSEMEAMAGTEEVLRGQRPEGVNCWTEEGELTNSNGVPVLVKDIKVGDEHIALTGPGPIGACHKNYYNGNMKTINSYGNLPVTVTENHKFPVLVGTKIIQKKASELKIKDLLLAGYFRYRDGIEKLDINAYITGPEKIGGEKHGRTTITNNQANEIRSKLSNGELGQNLAKEYKISIAAISRIKNNKSFKLNPKTKQVPFKPIIDLNEDVLWLFGMYLAKGMVAYAKKENKVTEVRWTLHTKEKNLADKLVCILKNDFGLKSTIRYRKTAKAMDVCVSNRMFARLMLSLFNTGALIKHIHPDLFRTIKSLLPLVAGWFDGDGSKDGNTLKGSTISKNIASQMRSILLDEKIYCTINKVKTQNNRIARYPQYCLRTSASDADHLIQYSNRFIGSDFKCASNNQGRRGFWFGNFYASYVCQINDMQYDGYIYNVTMDERVKEGKNTGQIDAIDSHNSVNSFGLFTFQSAIMLDVLRKQALSSRSAILQAWDESLQVEGSSLLMEVIKHVKNDPRYLERLKILSREKASRFTIDSFSGADLSDNVIVKVDTASQAMGSREAKQARAIEIMQYAPGLIQLPITLQEKLVEDLGWPDTMQPKGQDIIRAKNILSYIKNNRFDLAVPFPEDDPYVIHDLLVEELKGDSFVDLPLEQQKKIIELIEEYQREIERVERAQLKMQAEMAAMQAEMAAPPEGS